MLQNGVFQSFLRFAAIAATVAKNGIMFIREF